MTATTINSGYVVVAKAPAFGEVLEHRRVAAVALGKVLPPRAVVHHIDEDRTNNEPANLVICQDASYHRLLHVRATAYAATGSYEWRKCCLCGVYDSPENLHIGQRTAPNRAYHRVCNATRQKTLRQHRKDQTQ